MKFLILGAGQPEYRNKPSALAELGTETRLVDWLLQATSGFFDDAIFVGGYQMESIQRQCTDLRYVQNKRWEDTQSTGSLFEAPLGESPRWMVTYSDIVYRRCLVESMLESSGDIVIGIDTEWTDRYHGRSSEDLSIAEKVNVVGDRVTKIGGQDFLPDQADAEFIGVVDFRESAVSCLKTLAVEEHGYLENTNLSVLLERMRSIGLDVRAVDAAGDWAELNSSEDLAQFVLGTKAQTLARLRPIVEKSKIEAQVMFTVSEWEKKSSEVLTRIQSQFGKEDLVVRSSATTEDGFESSKAGSFTSVLDVNGASERALTAAIDEVIESYDEVKSTHQVLVQPMVTNTRASGVVFTRTLEEGTPYYVVNYDTTPDVTDAVTDGSGIHETLFVRRDEGTTTDAVPRAIQSLLEAVREIESLVGSEALDVEFAIGKDSTVHVLQVRPLSTVSDGANEGQVNRDEPFLSRLDDVAEQVSEAARSRPHLKGERAVFGVMPDWNPAEIVGRRPRRLALSLYKHLVTDYVWAQQRAEFGYQDVRPALLLAVFGGQPYVDVRASLNSFVPASLSEKYTESLVEFCLERLRRRPELHDKIEFEIIPTCFTLNFNRWEQLLVDEAGLARNDVAAHREALLQITRNAMDRIEGDLRRVEELVDRRREIADQEMDPLKEAATLLDDCRRLGTLPFAHLARCGFVAVTLLRSAEAAGIVPDGFEEEYLQSVRTVGQELTRDSAKVSAGKMSWEQLVAKYGHLRPGTYEVTAPAYWEDPERFLGPLVERVDQEDHAHDGEEFDQSRLKPIVSALQSEGLEVDVPVLDTFLREAVEGRESSKFEFTRNLSRALDLLVTFGESIGHDREDLSHCRIEDLLSLRQDGLSRRMAKDTLHQRAEEGRRWHQEGEGIYLPALITHPKDVNAFSRAGGRPNFVGQETVRAKVVDLETCGDQASLDGRIACIPQADPGYDWIFGRGIAGLITMYGGANSHMAIRAAEFGLPAAIGVGEDRFAEYRQAQTLELDPANQRASIIKVN